MSDALERLFHEPNRLKILSRLAGAPKGLTFAELKASCQLTDGNLSRHLKMLEAEKAIAMQKEFVNLKPRTTVFLSENGRQSFLAYLQALEAVLKEAQAATQTQADQSPAIPPHEVRPEIA